MNAQIIVEERSQIAQARREAVKLAKQLSIEEPIADRMGLAVTEAATNLVKHGGGGSILIAPLLGDQVIGLEVIAIDRGQGMRSVAASMRDGHSTAGSPGLGLGSISRLASNLDIYSRPDAGTVLRFEIWASETKQAPAPMRVGGVCVAMRGEPVSGDAWSLRRVDGNYRLLVVDGLGHGPDAAAAAQSALRIADQNPTLQPAALLETMHAALRSTRGAAAAVATVSPHHSAGQFAGIGNIRGVVRTGQDDRSLVSHNGTLGHNLRKIQMFDFTFPAGTALFMHSDGIATHWDLAAYPGIERHHPAVIAATIYRDHARLRDDATIVVLRHEPVASR